MPRIKTPHVRRISPGTRILFLAMYLPWLLHMFPYSYWASTCSAALPTYTAFMIPVRQVSDLPPASFRFPVTRDTLAFDYNLPAVGRFRDFHPLECAPAGRTNAEPAPRFWWSWLILFNLCPAFRAERVKDRLKDWNHSKGFFFAAIFHQQA